MEDAARGSALARPVITQNDERAIDMKSYDNLLAYEAYVRRIAHDEFVIQHVGKVYVGQVLDFLKAMPLDEKLHPEKLTRQRLAEIAEKAGVSLDFATHLLDGFFVVQERLADLP